MSAPALYTCPSGHDTTPHPYEDRRRDCATCDRSYPVARCGFVAPFVVVGQPIRSQQELPL